MEEKNNLDRYEVLGNITVQNAIVETDNLLHNVMI